MLFTPSPHKLLYFHLKPLKTYFLLCSHDSESQHLSPATTHQATAQKVARVSLDVMWRTIPLILLTAVQQGANNKNCQLRVFCFKLISAKALKTPQWHTHEKDLYGATIHILRFNIYIFKISLLKQWRWSLSLCPRFLFYAITVPIYEEKASEERGLMFCSSLIQILMWKIQLSCI